MVTTPVKPPVTPPRSPVPATKPSASPQPKPNPQQSQGDGRSLAELDTQATQERLEQETGRASSGEHYLREQLDQEEARQAERVETQAAAKRAVVTGESVPIIGEPPRSDMMEGESLPDESTLPESTRAEMAAGRDGLKSYEARNKAEQEAGQKALKDRAPVPPTPIGHSED